MYIIILVMFFYMVIKYEIREKHLLKFWKGKIQNTFFIFKKINSWITKYEKIYIFPFFTFFFPSIFFFLASNVWLTVSTKEKIY